MIYLYSGVAIILALAIATGSILIKEKFENKTEEQAPASEIIYRDIDDILSGKKTDAREKNEGQNFSNYTSETNESAMQTEDAQKMAEPFITKIPTKKLNEPETPESILEDIFSKNTLTKPSKYTQKDVQNEDLTNLITNFYDNKKTTKITEEQEGEEISGLRNYGNTLAEMLTTFEGKVGDETGTLEKFFATKQDTMAINGVIKLAHEYRELSTNLDELAIPSILADAHRNMVHSYDNIGVFLQKVATAKTDKELYERIMEYNKVAEGVPLAHISISTALKAFGVKFKPGEPGEVFMFSGFDVNKKGFGI